MKDNETSAVVSPLLASGLLGSGAYGSHLLDNYLASIGLSKGLSINPEAEKAIKAYADLTPEAVKDPSKYIYRYADLANKASKARLFNEDPGKTWEWFSNNEKFTGGLSSAASKGSRSMSKLRFKDMPKINDLLSSILGKRTASKITNSIDSKILHPTHSYLVGAESLLSPARKQVNHKRTLGGKNTAVRELAHEAEIGKSGTRSLLRLMMESMDKANGLGHPDKLAKETARALRRWNKEVYGNNREFKNALEYYNYRNGLSIKDKEYADYFKHFDHLQGKKLGKKELLDEVRKMLAPTSYVAGSKLGKATFLKELTNALGSTGKWRLDESTGRLVQQRRFKLKEGIRNVGDMKKIINNSPILTYMRSGIKYEGKPFGALFKALKIGQLLRNKKLRLALGIGSAGMGALGLSNLGRNIFGKKEND